MRTPINHLLRDVNPVLPGRRAELEELARSMRPRIPVALSPESLTASPSQSRPRTRLRIAIAAAVIAALAISPALGLPLPTLNFGNADPAPAKVIKQFDALRVGAPAGMDAKVLADETRAITTSMLDGRPHTLWVAPTTFGGFCTLWTQLGGGCDRLGTTPLDVSWGGSGGSASGLRAVNYLFGHVDSDYADGVEVRFADGTTAQPQVVWVSEPIRAGFFLYGIPEEKQMTGAVEAVVALSGNEVVATSYGDPVGHASEVPADAIRDRARVIARTITGGGDAVVWEAPSRYEGRCAWLAYQGRVLNLNCYPRGYGADGIVLGFMPTPTDVLVWARAGAGATSLEAQFNDGARDTVAAEGGFLLYPIPRERLIEAKRPTQFVIRSTDGNPIVTVPIPDGRALCGSSSPAEPDQCPVD